jgi:hypothetical protein
VCICANSVATHPAAFEASKVEGLSGQALLALDAETFLSLVDRALDTCEEIEQLRDAIFAHRKRSAFETDVDEALVREFAVCMRRPFDRGLEMLAPQFRGSYHGKKGNG